VCVRRRSSNASACRASLQQGDLDELEGLHSAAAADTLQQYETNVAANYTVRRPPPCMPTGPTEVELVALALMRWRVAGVVLFLPTVSCPWYTGEGQGTGRGLGGRVPCLQGSMAAARPSWLGCPLQRKSASRATLAHEHHNRATAVLTVECWLLSACLSGAVVRDASSLNPPKPVLAELKPRACAAPRFQCA
jgi:hypothetical protein